MDEPWVTPDWPAPPRVRAVTTTRAGGVSAGPWASMNPADHVGDAGSAGLLFGQSDDRDLGLGEYTEDFEPVVDGAFS